MQATEETSEKRPASPPKRRRVLPAVTAGDVLLVGLLLVWAASLGWLLRQAFLLLGRLDLTP